MTISDPFTISLPVYNCNVYGIFIVYGKLTGQTQIFYGILSVVLFLSPHDDVRSWSPPNTLYSRFCPLNRSSQMPGGVTLVRRILLTTRSRETNLALERAHKNAMIMEQSLFFTMGQAQPLFLITSCSRKLKTFIILFKNSGPFSLELFRCGLLFSVWISCSQNVLCLAFPHTKSWQTSSQVRFITLFLDHNSDILGDFSALRRDVFDEFKKFLIRGKRRQQKNTEKCWPASLSIQFETKNIFIATLMKN